MMTLKAQSEVHYLQEAGSTNVGAKRQEVQDWLVLWIFNHFFSGAEAFVSAQSAVLLVRKTRVHLRAGPPPR